MLDVLGIEKAVFVGHDWGGFLVWAMPYLHPDRVAGVVGVNTPLMARSPVPPTQLMRMLVGGRDEKFYILWFQQPGVAEAVLDANPGLLFEKLLRTGVPMEEVAKRLAADFDLNPFRRLAELEPMGEPICRP
jgi:pimeloyl-ACP methyl ester carboxylesterase